MTLCYLALGSNLQNPERQLRKAIASIRSLPSTHLIKVANLYHNKAVGRKAQPDYCNTVVAIQTTLTAHQLLLNCRKIEKKQGRIRTVPWGSRTLDIDILLFGSRKIHSHNLIIPHPRYQQRPFVLIPLSEIADNCIHFNYT